MTTNLLAPQYLETIPCNLCGSPQTKPWAEKDGWKIVECVKCGLVYINPRLNLEGLKIAYGSEYFQMHTENNAQEKRIRMYDIEVKGIENFRKGGKMLDVGCGGGYFMSRFGNSWEKYATEFNPVAAENARKEFSLDVRVGALPELGYQKDYFDVISMRGVIEHFQDPYSYLTESYKILKKGGMIAINTPNIGSYCAKIYKENFCLVAPLYHIYYFSTQTMTEMLKKAGFKILAVRYYYLGTPYLKWNDGPRVALDTVRAALGMKTSSPSPAFFDNVVHVYAEK